MLICSKERLLPSNVNMMVLKDVNDMYYYIHRSLYDQAVILEDRYSSNVSALKRALGYESEEDVEAVDIFVRNVPRPINILGYFLYINKDVDKLNKDIRSLCGVIHVMSSVLNLREFLKIPKEVRAGVEFSLSIEEEYSISWDRFFSEAITYGSANKTPQREYSYKSTNETEVLTLENAVTDEDFLRLLDEDFTIDLTYDPTTATDDYETETYTKVEEKVENTEKPNNGLSVLRGL